MLAPEEMFDRPIGGENKENEIPHWCGNILWILVTLVQKIITRYRVHGIENVRNLQGVSGGVVAATHHSFLDVSFIWCAIRPTQWGRMMARDTLFKKNRLIAQLMARCAAFPVTRDSADRTAIKRAAGMLRNKEIVCIFPEGTRRGKTDTPPTLHAGAALIARTGKAPLIPACARNSDKVKEKGRLFFRWPTVHVFFGKPVFVKWFDFLPKEERLEACVWYVMRESFALQEGCAPEDVDMAALFPDSKDYAPVFAGRMLGEG